MKRVLSFGIILFWLVMVGLLIRRTAAVDTPSTETRSSPSAIAPDHAPLAEHEGWMGIYHQDKKIGYFHRRLIPVTGGYQWQERSQMKLRVMNTDQTVHTE